MLSFSPEFFKPEVRNDFYIDSTMKTVWAAEMEVLAVVTSVCEKYQLPWYVHWGSLLGAVRHGGYIPWDDDLDICLMRKDFQKLMEVLPKELPEGWILRNEVYGKPQEQYWACVFNSGNISIEKKRLEEFHGCPFIIGLDIYQLDYLPNNKQDLDMEIAVFRLIWGTVTLLRKEELTEEKITEEDWQDINDGIAKIEEVTGDKVDRDKDIVSQLWGIANKMCISYGNEKKCTYVANFLDFVKTGKKYKKQWYAETEYLPFENVEVPVPAGYDEVLKTIYGDYSVFIKNAQSHDYPFYNKQLEHLRKIVKEMEDKYNA